MERISDHAVNITEGAEEMKQKNMTFSADAEKEIGTYADAVREILRLSVESFIKADKKEAVLVEPLEEVIDDLKDELKMRHVNVFDKRREKLLKLIADIDGVYAVEPDGAFYVMMVVGDLYGKSYGDKQINGSIDFADALLEAEKVATIPGISFGADDCVRLSYSLSDADIQEGLLRIKRFVENLR